MKLTESDQSYWKHRLLFDKKLSHGSPLNILFFLECMRKCHSRTWNNMFQLLLQTAHPQMLYYVQYSTCPYEAGSWWPDKEEINYNTWNWNIVLITIPLLKVKHILTIVATNLFKWKNCLQCVIYNVLLHFLWCVNCFLMDQVESSLTKWMLLCVNS